MITFLFIVKYKYKLVYNYMYTDELFQIYVIVSYDSCISTEKAIKRTTKHPFELIPIFTCTSLANLNISWYSIIYTDIIHHRTPKELNQTQPNLLNWKSLTIYKGTLKQEAHGPHHLPEKTVQFNQHTWLYHNVD